MRSTTGRHHRRPRAGLCGHRLRRTCRNSGPTKSSRRSPSSSPGSPGRRAACAVSWCTARCNESMSMPREKRDSRPGKKPWPPVRERPQGPCQNHARHRTHRNREHERDDDGGEGESVTSSLDVHHRRPQLRAAPQRRRAARRTGHARGAHLAVREEVESARYGPKTMISRPCKRRYRHRFRAAVSDSGPKCDISHFRRGAGWLRNGSSASRRWRRPGPFPAGAPPRHPRRRGPWDTSGQAPGPKTSALN